MRTLAILATLTLIGNAACSKDKDEKASVGSKLRSAGTTTAMSLHEGAGFGLLDAMLANSAFNLESFKVPVYRINLVTNLTGSGYGSTSPDFYTCPGTTDDECYVDLANSTAVDNLLKNGGAGEIKVDNTTTYDGAAIEFCGTGGMNGETFKMLVKGTVNLGSTLYYTNATSGLSATGPSEEAPINAACGGQTTFLSSPVSLGPDDDVNLVVYVEPAGAVLATNYKTLVNSNCLGESTLAVCASRPSVFVTAGDSQPTIERYRLHAQDSSTKNYADMMMTLLFDSTNAPIGATVQQIYLNTAQERLMHTLQYTFSSVTESAGTYDLNFYGSTTPWIDNFSRTSPGSYVISELVDSAVTVDASRL